MTVALLLPGVACLIWIESPWLQVLNAAWMAFAFTQVVFLGHDVGHRQVFRKTWKNDLVGYLGMPVTGLSLFWWMDTHNRHHAHPNQTGKDPAIDFSFLAFSEGQALAKRGIYRWLVRYQALYFIPVCLLYPVSMRIQTIRFYRKGGGRRPALEIALLVLHHVLYLGGIFALLPAGTALIFIGVHQGLFSLFMVSTFAPNHKGLEILGEEERWDFLKQQVVTAQNVKGGYLTDIWYGGLNFQIEHHLFPTMPRCSLRRAAPIVREFCRKESIPYREIWPIPFYWNLIRYMHRVAAPLRASGPA